MNRDISVTIRGIPGQLQHQIAFQRIESSANLDILVSHFSWSDMKNLNLVESDMLMPYCKRGMHYVRLALSMEKFFVTTRHLFVEPYLPEKAQPLVIRRYFPLHQSKLLVLWKPDGI